MKKFTLSAIFTESFVTRTRFAIPVASKERNVAVKFLPCQPSGWVGEVEKEYGRMDAQTVRDDKTLPGI